MRRILQILALVIAISAVVLWAAAGAQRGWTKTSVPVKTMDEITGIEAISYEERFVPGVDFLGGAFLAAALLAGASLIVRNRKKPITA